MTIPGPQTSAPPLSAGAATSLALLLLPWGCAEPPPPSPQRPERVVLIVVDTLRKDHLGCYGYERDTSPSIDRLAAESVRYERAVSQAPWTTPSIGALLSSRFPSTLGIRNERSVLGEDVVLLPEVLSEHGFATGAAVSHTFCSSKWGFDQGFDAFDESQAQRAISSEEVTRFGLEFVEEHADEPFFLWLHYFDPHWSYHEHEEHDFGGEGYEGPVRAAMPMREMQALREELSPDDVAQLVRQYDSEIAHTDRWIGRVLDRLRELGLFEKSLVIFVADHGEEFMERGRLGHSGSLYREVIEVPLIIHFPGVEPAVVEEPVASVDVFPTVLYALGLPSPGGLVGRPIYPDVLEPRPVFSETRRGGDLRAVVVGDTKLVRNVRTGRTRLYDLATDPTERIDLYPQRAADVADLEADLEAWISLLEASSRDSAEASVSEEEAQRLRDMGYMGE